MKASARFVSTVNRFGLGATVLASVALLLGVAAPPASAATATDSYGYLTSFGSGESSGSYAAQYNAVTVDGGTGNILVAEQNQGGGGPGQRVMVYSPDPAAGGTLLTILDVGGPNYYPNSVAFDQSGGALYFSSFGNIVHRFLSDGAPVPTYTEDMSYAMAAGAPGPMGGMAVDSVNHDVLVGTEEPARVYRYDPTGALIGSFDGSNTVGGAFKGVRGLAVGPTGTVYVLDAVGGRVEEFNTAGASLGKLPIPAGRFPNSIAVNPQSGEVAVTVVRQDRTYLEGFTAAGVPTFSSRLPAQAGGIPTGLAWDAGTGRIYLDNTTGIVHTFVPAKLPGVDLPTISQLTPTSAHLEAEVAPGGEVPPGTETTTARLEYCPATAACGNYSVSNPADPSNPWVRLTEYGGLNANGEVTIEDDLTGLIPNFSYLVRVSADRTAADNALTGNTSAATPLDTPAIPPGTETNDANDVSETAAVLNGTINPFGLPTTYHFEYGTTTAYGSRAPVGIEGVAGTERVDKRFSRTISGLEPGTTYHYRLVAQNSAGVNKGADHTFTTAAAGAVLHRAYEQVTPVDKGGSAIYEGIGFQAKADGSAISYATQGNSSSAPTTARSMSLRGGGDWTGGIVLDPPLNTTGKGLIGATTLAVSPDFTHTLVATNRKLTPDAIEDGMDRLNLYVVDVVTGVHALVATTPNGLQSLITVEAANSFFAGAPDFSWVVFKSPVPLKTGAPGNALYRWSTAGGLEVVSVLPDGEMAGADVGGDKDAFVRSVSADGSRIYFNSGEIPVENFEPGAGVFLWEGGPRAKAISVSHIPGDPAAPHAAKLVGASKDGRYAFFISKDGVKLTPDSPGGGGDLYRYDASDESLEYLGAAGNAPIAVADDGRTAYWRSGQVFVWRDGVVETATPSLGSVSQPVAISPDGRYLAYAEGGNMDAGGQTPGDVYLYDFEADQRSCASCLPDGSLGTGFLRDIERFVSNRNEQAVTDSGQLFFTTSARLVAADVNGSEDVYEYKDGKNTLISPGNAPFDARFADISEDGSDVFFTTAQKLVGQDNDKTVDLYDARINGGLAKQNPPPPQECLRDDCKATPNVGPELPFGGSEALSGPGNVTGAARKRCAKGTHARKVKGKTRCVKQSKAKKKAKNTKRTNTNRRQGR